MGHAPQLLLAARLRLQLSQAELADTIGASPKTVQRWERGIAVPTLYYQRRLCTSLGLAPQDLGFSNEGTASPASPLHDPLMVAVRETAIVGRDQELTTLEGLC